MAETGDIFRKFRAPSLIDTSVKPKREGDYWNIDGFESREGPNGYDQTFKDLFQGDEKDIAGLLRLRKSQGRSCHILDVMGRGFFLLSETYGAVDSVTGFRLEDPREAMKQSFQTELDLFRSSENKHHKQMIPQYERYLADLEHLPEALNHAIVSGSVFDKQAWNKLKMNMHTRNIPYYDLVVCRPVAPFHLNSIKPKNMEERQSHHIAYLQMMDRVLNLASPDSVILTQIPDVFTLEEAERWKTKLTKNKPFMNVKFAHDRRGTESDLYVARVDIHK